MNKQLTTYAVAILACLAILIGCGTEAVSKDQEAKVGKAAPNFTLTSADGDEISLADYKGKYVVLEWINFDCPFVKKHYSVGHMQALQAEYTEKGVVWLSICSSAPGKQGYFEGEELTTRIADQKSKAVAYLIDQDGTVGLMYGAKTTPNMFVIDPKGKLVYAGAIDDKPTPKSSDISGAVNYVSAALDAVMAGKEVAVTTTAPYGCSVKY